MQFDMARVQTQRGGRFVANSPRRTSLYEWRATARNPQDYLQALTLRAGMSLLILGASKGARPSFAQGDSVLWERLSRLTKSSSAASVASPLEREVSSSVL